VRLIGPDGNQLGIKPVPEALRMARGLDLDLVEVAPMAKPPVCRIMDYGKFRYEEAQKAKEARRKSTNVTIKEVKFRPKIDRHDYEVKMRRAVQFLQENDKVKVTMMFRGREVTHPEIGRNILERLSEDVADYGEVEIPPKMEGRNMTMVIAPLKKG
jgi:translation initiation factor IF-3